MNHFRVGEKVVALTNPGTSKSQPRKAGNVYRVMAVNYCVGCGQQRINIGVASECSAIGCGCGSIQSSSGLHWTYSHLFTRPISNEYKMEVAIPELITIEKLQLQ